MVMSRLTSVTGLLALTVGCGDARIPGMGQSVQISNNGGSIQLRLGNQEPVIGSGKIASESRNVVGFQGVAVSTPVQVTVNLADSESATVEADDNVLPLIATT